ncbi:hypothetical protein MJO29_014666 [Puccinia striiformis f. sp. tritici]|nr:hypothetical protein MJO29_014666 [Puccinia striiformis f. sp. tritici]
MSNSSDHNKSLSQVTNLTANTGRSEPLNTAEKPIAEALNHSQSTFHSISLLPSISTDFASVAGRNEEIEHSEKTPLTPKTRMNGGQPITHTKFALDCLLSLKIQSTNDQTRQKLNSGPFNSFPNN